MLLPYVAEDKWGSIPACLIELRSNILGGWNEATVECINQEGEKKNYHGFLLDIYTGSFEKKTSPHLLIHHPDSEKSLQLIPMTSFEGSEEVVNTITLIHNLQEIYNREVRGIFE